MRKDLESSDAPAEKLVGCDGYVRLGGAHITGDNGHLIQGTMDI